MRSTKKVERREKITGYTLLGVGLALIIVPALVAFAIFLTSTQIPQLVPISQSESDGFVKAIVAFSNVCLIFFVFVAIIWAGSIVTSRGVTLIKDVKLKLVRKSLRQLADLAEKSAGNED